MEERARPGRLAATRKSNRQRERRLDRRKVVWVSVMKEVDSIGIKTIGTFVSLPLSEDPSAGKVYQVQKGKVVKKLHALKKAPSADIGRCVAVTEYTVGFHRS